MLYTQGLPGGGWDGKSKVMLKGETQDGIVHFTGKHFQGTIKDSAFSGTAENDVKFELTKVERKSPTLGAPPPPGAVVLFDGTNTNAWKEGKIVEGKLLGVPAVGKDAFEDFTLHIEFITPFMPRARGQGRGNSGVYLLDQYEVQVLDSFGLKGKDDECGGVYKQARPLVNMCFPPLSWQTYDIEFRAARFAPTAKQKGRTPSSRSGTTASPSTTTSSSKLPRRADSGPTNSRGRSSCRTMGIRSVSRTSGCCLAARNTEIRER